MKRAVYPMDKAKALVASGSSDGNAYVTLAHDAIGHGDIPHAIANLEKVRALEPDNAEEEYTLAILLIRAHQGDRGVSIMRDVANGTDFVAAQARQFLANHNFHRYYSGGSKD
jgi:hypothetical protein